MLIKYFGVQAYSLEAKNSVLDKGLKKKMMSFQKVISNYLNSMSFFLAVISQQKTIMCVCAFVNINILHCVSVYVYMCVYELWRKKIGYWRYDLGYIMAWLWKKNNIVCFLSFRKSALICIDRLVIIFWRKKSYIFEFSSLFS